MHIVGKYRIDICQEHAFTGGSADNAFSYDFEYFIDSPYSASTVVGIKIFEDEELSDSVVIGASGGATGLHENAVIFEEDRFLICCADTIFCLSIPDLVLRWQVKADEITCFEIFKYQSNYIVHGEIYVTCLDRNGDIIWQRMGRDIFVVMDNKPAFVLEKDYIIVRDFNNEIYKFGYDGNVVDDE
ncbi:hypothetical protein [Emticicia agri]|uniref:Uncharacterized protein n=1 Tax=Emticicia agri TaxID=2492393 RepID=A0A4Q5LUK1_9BACT|nr:hypothetical protein [Emticicia agri]RYU93113.1 hypothetical protein EWM59_23795 [Emticicia agri]